MEFLLLGISLQRERTKDIFRASLLVSADKVFQRICPTTRNRAGFLITAPLTTVKHSDRYPSWVYELMFYGTYCPFCFARKEKGFGIVSCVSSYALKGPWDQIAMDIHNGFKEGDYVSQLLRTEVP